MADWKIRLARPADADDVLAADIPGRAGQCPCHPALSGGCRDDGCPKHPDLGRKGWPLVGCASGTVLDHPDTTRTVFAQELGVNEEARRRGIARALLAALRAEGRARSCRVTRGLTEGDKHLACATDVAIGERRRRAS